MLNNLIIQKAFRQNRPFDLSFDSDKKSKDNLLRCKFVEYGNYTLIFELHKTQTLADECINLPVHGFFCVYIDNKMECFSFIANIVDIFRPLPEICKIMLSMPTMLESCQRRRFFRVPVSQEYVLAAALWRNKAIPSEHVSTITRLSDPELVFLPRHTLHFSLVNISVGGTCMSIPRKTMRNYAIDFNIKDRFLLMFSLYDSVARQPLRLLLRCRTRNIMFDQSSEHVLIGLQYESWLHPAELSKSSKSKNVEWLALFTEIEAISIYNIEMYNIQDQKLENDMIDNQNAGNKVTASKQESHSRKKWLHLRSSEQVEPLSKWIMQEQLRLLASQDDTAAGNSVEALTT